MSRIAGIITEDPSALSTVKQMLAVSSAAKEWKSLTRRNGNAALGWTGRDNPELGGIDGLLVALDGVIYNDLELGKGESTSSLIAELYRRYGFEDALQRLNGDFAIALYDSSQQTLWLARDRFGLKPLYYVRRGEYFGFASRLRALLLLPGASYEPRRDYVGRFAGSHYRYIDSDPGASPFVDIQQLPGSTFIKVRNGILTTTSYWRLHEGADFSDTEDVLAERYRTLLFNAVSRRLRKAGKRVFTLSGGMDSSSVLSSAAYLTGSKQPAISTVYVDKTYDETQEIASMLDSNVERWYPVSVDAPEVFDLVNKMIALHDEPVATATWLSHFLLCQEASNTGFDSVFGGLGGDELNAGEYEHFFLYFADLKANGQDDRLAHEVQKWVDYHDHPVFRKSMDVVKSSFARMVDFGTAGRCLPDKTRLLKYATALNPDFYDLRSFEPIMEAPFASYLKNRTYLDLFYETAPCCLRAEDRQTQGFGLQNFLPFFDHDLVKFMFRVPGNLKIRDGVTKVLLRSAMRGILPEETRTRIKKTGWNAPAHRWFSGKGKEQLLDLIRSSRFRQRAIYNVPEVERLLDEHEEIVSKNLLQENHMMFFWQLLNVELWLESLSEYRVTGTHPCNSSDRSILCPSCSE